jgi:hypothetical protein
MNGLTSDPGYSVDYGTALYTDKGGAVLNPPGASNGTAFQGAGGGLALWQGKQADYNFCMEMYNILP